jgi:phospholipid/cholesterol/gamma-HCH transport system ATP-binding protein
VTGQDNAVISFDRVSKSFADKPVLQDVTLSVARNEALCIVGRSGTGKSVTLKLMIALIKPDAGRILIDGDDITRLQGRDLSRVRRKMGFLFQNAALFDFLTLYDNLALPLRRLTRKTHVEIEEIIDRVLGQVGLNGDRKKMPGELSGGMKKRACLARALVLEPEILLVDEPSSGLDRITASEIDELLIQQKRNMTMVIVSHDVHGARRVCDRFAVLDKGCLAAFGKVQDLDHHENNTVRRLVTEDFDVEA